MHTHTHGNQPTPQPNRVTGYPESKAYLSDAAVLVLNQDLGSKTGTLGIKFSPEGYQGRLYAAGYPGQSIKLKGSFWALKGNCQVDDNNGRDGKLLFKVRLTSRGG